MPHLIITIDGVPAGRDPPAAVFDRIGADLMAGREEGAFRVDGAEIDWELDEETIMETTNANTLAIEDVKDAIRKAYISGAKRGQFWWYARVWPGGEITTGCEISQCVPEGEYFRRGNPYPLTFWSETFNEVASPAWNTFEWEPCKADEAEFWTNEGYDDYQDEPDDRHPLPARLSDLLIDDIDWDAILPDIRERLEEAGYAIVD